MKKFEKENFENASQKAISHPVFSHFENSNVYTYIKTIKTLELETEASIYYVRTDPVLCTEEKVKKKKKKIS